MTTGEKIRNARNNAQLTQKALGELCGIAEPTIRRYEADKLHPKPQTLKKIAAALGMAWYELSSDIELRFDRDLIVSAIQKASPSNTYSEHQVEALKRALNDFGDALLEYHVDDDELILISYHKLNRKGRKEAIKRTTELTLLEEYTTPDSPPDGKEDK